ncbi:MAG: hypothetical protein WC455_10475 [Dehalococcoidia bacterium]|jgi:hypothetical protein
MSKINFPEDHAEDSTEDAKIDALIIRYPNRIDHSCDDLYCNLNSFPDCENEGRAYLFLHGEDPEGLDVAVACSKCIEKLISQGKL